MDDRIRIANLRIGTPFPGDNAPAVRYYLEDHLGNCSFTLGTTGTLFSREDFAARAQAAKKAFEKETSYGSFAKKRYRFCGKVRDAESPPRREESRLYYYGAWPAAAGAAWTCRFMSVDPSAGKYPFYTPYQYQGNQPVIAIDLDGLEEDPKEPTSTQKIDLTEPSDSELANFSSDERKNWGLLSNSMEAQKIPNKPEPLDLGSADDQTVIDSFFQSLQYDVFTTPDANWHITSLGNITEPFMGYYQGELKVPNGNSIRIELTIFADGGEKYDILKPQYYVGEIESHISLPDIVITPESDLPEEEIKDKASMMEASSIQKYSILFKSSNGNGIIKIDSYSTYSGKITDLNMVDTDGIRLSNAVNTYINEALSRAESFYRLKQNLKIKNETPRSIPRGYRLKPGSNEF